MYNKNAAFDINMIPKKSRKSAQIFELPNGRERKQQKIRSMKMAVYSAFSVFFASAMGVSVFIFGQARLTEFTDKVSKASKQLEQCKSENTALMLSAGSYSLLNDSENFDSSNVEIVKVPSADSVSIK